MLRSTFIMALCLGLSAAATLTKKDGYGGTSGGSSYTAQSSYGTSGSSYDAASAPVAYASGSDNNYGNNVAAAASYSAGSPSYGSGSYGASGGSSYNSAGSSGSSGGSEGYSSNGDSGNLYYYYYPVTNHSSSSSAGHSYSSGGGQQSYGNQGPQQGYGGNNYYPPAPVPPPFSDPLTGLLSLWGAVDFNSFILPALLIGGVALLLPAILNCDLELGTCVIPLPFSNTGGRKSRGMESDWSMQQATIPQMIDHVYKVYGAVAESDQCMQRVVCEFGGMMRNVRGKEMVFNILEQFATSSMKKQLYVLKQGALATPSPNPTCSKFICDKLDNKVE